MVSLLGESIAFYNYSIIATYVLLGVYAVMRFFSERSKGFVWLFKGGQWVAVKTINFIYIFPLVLIPIYMFVYYYEVRIGFVSLSNGVFGSLVVVELVKWWRKHW